eukprot:m.50880 g.50880  ORF g.50880 m.50880 type:complete len:464 (-) comp6263_c0_seq1:177-1568(-)
MLPTHVGPDGRPVALRSRGPSCTSENKLLMVVFLAFCVILFGSFFFLPDFSDGGRGGHGHGDGHRGIFTEKPDTEIEPQPTANPGGPAFPDGPDGPGGVEEEDDKIEKPDDTEEGDDQDAKKVSPENEEEEEEEETTTTTTTTTTTSSSTRTTSPTTTTTTSTTTTTTSTTSTAPQASSGMGMLGINGVAPGNIVNAEVVAAVESCLPGALGTTTAVVNVTIITAATRRRTTPAVIVFLNITSNSSANLQTAQQDLSTAAQNGDLLDALEGVNAIYSGASVTYTVDPTPTTTTTTTSTTTTTPTTATTTSTTVATTAATTVAPGSSPATSSSDSGMTLGIIIAIVCVATFGSTMLAIYVMRRQKTGPSARTVFVAQPVHLDRQNVQNPLFSDEYADGSKSNPLMVSNPLAERGLYAETAMNFLDGQFPPGAVPSRPGSPTADGEGEGYLDVSATDMQRQQQQQ